MNGGGFIANLKRNVSILFRLTEDERELLKNRIQASGVRSQEEYLRKMALTGYILRIDITELRETLRLMSNATNNINQIARRANETRSIYASDMIQIREEIGKLRGQVADALKVFKKAKKLMDM